MTDAVLGIDVSKNTFDTNLGAGTKARSKSFANSPAGWHHLIAWLGEHKIGQGHACLEATWTMPAYGPDGVRHRGGAILSQALALNCGNLPERHGLGIALALHEAG